MNTVLIVDDDEQILSGLAAMLKLENIPAEVASDQESAETLMEAQFFPLVLADLRLRQANDGLQLIEAVRRISPASKIVAMTGGASAETEAAALSLGAGMVLRKPFPGEELVAAIKSMLATVRDPENLEEVYLATTPRLRAMVSRRFNLSPADGEDLIQQAWCIMLERRSQVREIGPFLAGTVMNLARQTMSRQMRERDLDALPTALCSFSEDHAPGLAVRGALAKLDGRSRALCQMIAIEQRSYAEVSKRLSLPAGSIGPLFIRAKQRLKQELMN